LQLPVEDGLQPFSPPGWRHRHQQIRPITRALSRRLKRRARRTHSSSRVARRLADAGLLDHSGAARPCGRQHAGFLAKRPWLWHFGEEEGQTQRPHERRSGVASAKVQSSPHLALSLVRSAGVRFGPLCAHHGGRWVWMSGGAGARNWRRWSRVASSPSGTAQTRGRLALAEPLLGSRAAAVRDSVQKAKATAAGRAVEGGTAPLVRRVTPQCCTERPRNSRSRGNA